MNVLTAIDASDADPTATARLSEGIFRYNITFELPIKNQRCNAPYLLEQILSSMKNYDNNIVLKTASGVSIALTKFPTEKQEFDDFFQPVTPRNKPSKLVIGVHAASQFRFRDHKDRLFHRLRESQIWMNYHQCSLNQLETHTLGFFVFVHHLVTNPKFFRMKILETMKRSKTMTNEEWQEPFFYCQRSTVSGRYQGHVVESEVVMIKTSPEHAEHALRLLQTNLDCNVIVFDQL